MNDLARLAVDAALEAGADYADARVVDRRHEQVMVKNGAVEAVVNSTDAGNGVRTLVAGHWGFAATTELTPEAIREAAQLAVRIARASGQVPTEPAALSELEPVTDRWASQFEEDPFEVPLEDKVSLLLDADRAVRQEPKVRVSQAQFLAYRDHKWFASSEGSDIEQEQVECGAQLSAQAVEGEETQERSFPSGLGGYFAARGYEVMREEDWVAGGERMGREAAALLSAPSCPGGELPLIIDGSHMALQVHESCGHPIELDRVFGSEASYAGTSFLTPDKVSNLRYGSDAVNLVADATAPGGCGTFGYDDEGVPAQRTPIVERGMFEGYLTSRETASRLGWKSNGSMRADGWNRQPLVRMTNINLEPGDWSFDEMIEDMGNGLYMESTKSWSIDDRRLNFQFATEIGWEVKDGSLAGIIKNPTYQGVTPQFWGRCDAVGNRDHWRLWGVLNCAKGEPVQLVHVGHGAAPTRFSKVRVGVMQDHE
jgi:TldD protein